MREENRNDMKKADAATCFSSTGYGRDLRISQLGG